jgi:3-oxoacyl-[acyl-carrier protein] reductase
VVNNAFKQFVFDPDQRKLAWQLTREDYKGQIDGAALSTHYVCQAVLPAMEKQSQGSIIPPQKPCLLASIPIKNLTDMSK